MNLAETAITPALSRILETMYFCDPVYLGAGRLDAPVIGARVDFSGPRHGRFRLVVSERLALQMTVDFLAADAEALTRKDLVSTVRELANVACCTTVSDWMPEADFHYSVPDDIEASEIPESFPHSFAVADTHAELAVDVTLDGPG